MLSHTVCFKMKPYADGKNKGENLVLLEKELKKLPANISQIKAYNFALNEKGGKYDAVLVELFDDEAALEIYKKHPTHLEIVDFINKICAEMVEVDNLF